MEHDLFAKPVSTFPDHALVRVAAPAQQARRAKKIKNPREGIQTP
jgi:hypothetical protein